MSSSQSTDFSEFDTTTGLDPKHLYRQLDHLFEGVRSSDPPFRLLETFLHKLVDSAGELLPFRFALVYTEREHQLVLEAEIGGAAEPRSLSADPDHPLVNRLLKDRACIFLEDVSGLSPTNTRVFPAAPVAGIVVGEPPNRHFILFALGTVSHLDLANFALNTIQSALDARLAEHRIRGTVREAGEIQQSLLPDGIPAFPGYEIACRSETADEVSGDLYDFLYPAEDILALSIGDASGHGLPAALLVRDVVIGLRMGYEKEFKVGHVFTKLNRVIHRSNLSSRFVSLFCGELENNGSMVYINAGHQPPLLIGETDVIELTEGGTVIGPLADISFRRGFAHIDKGSTLLLFTDGLVERAHRTGELFGIERIIEITRANMKLSAQDLLDRIFAAVREFGGGAPWSDDVTAIVVRRLPTTDLTPPRKSQPTLFPFS